MNTQRINFIVSQNILYICTYGENSITVIPVNCFNSFDIPVAPTSALLQHVLGSSGTGSNSRITETKGSGMYHGNSGDQQPGYGYGPRGS